MKYCYFISYSYSSLHGTGYGNCEMRIMKEIESIEDTKELARQIKATGLPLIHPSNELTILFFTLLRIIEE